MKKVYLPLIFLFLIQMFAHAQVAINEVSTSNSTGIQDNYGDNSDWVELYNNTGTAVSLTGWYISDNPANPTKWQIPAGVNIPANGFRLVWCTGRDVVTGVNVHANFKLTQMSQESVVLSDATGTIVDQIQFTTPTKRDHSRGRQPNGTGAWKFFTTNSVTPGTSNNAAIGYDGYASKVVFSQTPGFYPAAISLSLSSPDAGATIRYTLDGTVPSQTSPIYSTPLNINQTSVIRAIAFPANGAFQSSFVETNTYFINENFTIPVVSLCGDYNSLFNGFGNNEIVNHIEYFDENDAFQWETEGDTRPHGNDSWAHPQKGMRFYVRDQYGYSNKIDYQIFKTTPRTDYDVVIIKAAGSDNYPGSFGLNSCHLRDVYSQTIAEDGHLDVDTRRTQHAIAFINGQYWGLYELRERVDADYTNYYYNQEEPDVDMLKHWGGTVVEYGSGADWYSLYNYIASNNMAVQANYDYVKTQFDVNSLIDYYILNTFTVNSDWLNWNTMWWRGREAPGVKWRYALWDMDNTFNLGQNYTVLNTTDYTNAPCDTDGLFAGDPDEAHGEIVQRLFSNQEFLGAYISRYADLVNTTFNCDKMIAHLDSLLAIMTPEMTRQTQRWGGSLSDWQANVLLVRQQILGRCAYVSGAIVDCYDDIGVSGPFQVKVNVDPPLSGTVTFNTVTPAAYPWTASYFGGVQIQLAANANTGYVFDYWSSNGSPINPNTLAPLGNTILSNPDSIVAHFKPIGLVATPSNTSICQGSSVTLTASGGTTYEWRVLNDPTIISNLSTLTVSPQTTTSYILTSGANSVTATVTVNPAPTVTLPAQSSVCQGQLFVFDAGTQAGYLWQNGSTNQTFSATTSGVYAVVVNNSFGCTASASGSLNVVNAPSLTLPTTQNICAGETLALSASSTGTPTYLWQNGATASSIEVSSAGSYSVVATENGCSASASVSVTEVALPVINLGGDRTFCAGEVLSLDATTTGATSYIWQDGTTAANLTVNNSGVYSVQVVVNGCTGIDEVQLTSIPVPVVNLGVDAAFCSGETVTLDATMPNATYLWQDNSTSAEYTVTQAGTYRVTVTTSNCSGSDEIVFSADDCNCEAKVPNVFTPNSDGKNDFFKPIVTGCSVVREYKFSVYDRWGKAVFTSDDSTQGWDANGFARDVYVWQLTFKNIAADGTEKTITETGDVTVLK